MDMTESHRRSGAENPHASPSEGGRPHVHAPLGSGPVDPAWPPPPHRPPAAGYPAPAGPEGPEGPRGKRTVRRPLALLAAVALVAAAVGGGTAYGIQELTGSTAASGTTGTTVVPAGRKGTVAGVAAAVGPSIVEISAATDTGASTGSGVIITGDGEIVTNNHVVSGASSITVRTGDGTTYTARTLGTDSSKDLALVKLENASGLPAATLGDSDGLRVGDQVVAIGSPEGLTGTVTSGIVSALGRDVTVAKDDRGHQRKQGGGRPFAYGGRQFNGGTGSSTTTYQAIQTDASLNPGNSGGALIDMNGAVVGVNSAMYSAAGSSSSADAGSVGLGFAIPVNTVKAGLASLRAGADG
nr:trypsin-like peptidase domain-containing protein [Streptomyces sp. NRRL F-5065]